MNEIIHNLKPRGGLIRVLVVDDSLLSRRLVREALSKDPQIEVVGGAEDGSIALKMIGMLLPSAITLDVDMPIMNGLDTLREIRKRFPRLVVIMCSVLTEHASSIAIQALHLGADDYSAKPGTEASFEDSVVALRQDLVPKLKQFFALPGKVPERASMRGEVAVAPRSTISNVPARSPGSRSLIPRRAVGVGVSTGGPVALAAIVPMIPAGFRLPILIVQHMPEKFTRLLASRLQALTSLRVVEASDGQVVTGGTIYIAPGDHHMRVASENGREKIRLNTDPPENFCRPAADVLFRSMAQVYGGGVVVAVLTGMGEDGLRGVRKLREKGAYVIAQDEASSVVWGMPACVAQAGLADAVVGLDCVVPEILKQL